VVSGSFANGCAKPMHINALAYTSMTIFRLVLLLLFLSPAVVFGQRFQQDYDAELARVGDRSITVRDFVERYENTPWIGRERRGLAERHKIEFLASLIAEELLAEEARRKGYAFHAPIKRTVEEIERLHVMDALYREEIIAPVSIYPEEIDGYLTRFLTEVGLQYITTESGSRAAGIYEAARFGVSFDSVATALGQQGQYETRRWGELAPMVEQAIYDTLVIGHIYPPFKVDDEWYVIKLAAIRHEHAGGAAELASARERVEKTLRWRREQQRYNTFLAEFSQGKGAQVNGYIIREVSLLIRRMMGEKIGLLELAGEYPFPLSLTGDDYDRLRKELQQRLGEAVITAPYFTLSLDYVIDRMAFKGFSLQDEEETVSEKLTLQLQTLIHEEYLAREGYDRHLDNDPAVVRDVGRWERAHLAFSLMRTLAAEAQVGAPSAVWEVRIRELVVNSAEDAADMIDRLHSGDELAVLAGRYSVRQDSRSRAGETSYFLTSERGTVGQAAALIDVGELFGPIEEDGRFVIFQLLDRREPLAMPSGQMAAATSASTRINETIARLAREHEVSVDLEQLARTPTTDVNKIVWRYLGFGNRMPAVPTLYKMVSWLDLLAPEERPL
jgi:hypothetical protein